MFNSQSTVQSAASELATTTNRVLRNTYLLLSLTLIFSAITAGIAVLQNAPAMNIWLSLVVMLGFPFLLQATRNSVWGLVFTFAYTGFIGWMIGPILNFYLTEFTNGAQLIMMAAGSTGLIFLTLSAIAMSPSRDFSSWGKFLMIVSTSNGCIQFYSFDTCWQCAFS